MLSCAGYSIEEKRVVFVTLCNQPETGLVLSGGSLVWPPQLLVSIACSELS